VLPFYHEKGSKVDLSMVHTRRRILIIKRGMSTFRINDDIEMTDAPQKMNLTQIMVSSHKTQREKLGNNI